MKRTITGLTAARSMSLGDLRQFIASLDGLPDEASVTAKVTFRKHLRSLTVEEEDLGFRDYIRAVGRDTPREPGKPAETGKPKTTKQTTSA